MKQILDKASDIFVFSVTTIACLFFFALGIQTLYDEMWIYLIAAFLLSFFCGFGAYTISRKLVKQDVSEERGYDIFCENEWGDDEKFKKKHPFLRAIEQIVGKVSLIVTCFVYFGALAWWIGRPLKWLWDVDYAIKMQGAESIRLIDIVFGIVMLLMILLLGLYVVITHTMSQYARSIKEDVKKSIQDALSQDRLKIKENTRDLSDKLDSFK